MHTGKTLFAQLMDFLPWTTFARIVERYGGDRYVKSLRCAEHFRVMAFAQLTYRESLRDIEACLSAQASKLYHIGFREPIRRSTRAAPRPASSRRLLRDPRQIESRRPSPLLGADRSHHRDHLRPDHRSQRLLQPAALSRSAASHPFAGRRKRQDIGLS